MVILVNAKQKSPTRIRVFVKHQAQGRHEYQDLHSRQLTASVSGKMPAVGTVWMLLSGESDIGPSAAALIWSRLARFDGHAHV